RMPSAADWVVCANATGTIARISRPAAMLIARRITLFTTRGADRLVDVEDLVQRGGDRGVVGVGGHQLAHVLPPVLADVGARDGGPLGFVFDLDVGEKLAALGVQEDRVVVHAVRFERLFQFRPDGAMTMLILVL